VVGGQSILMMHSAVSNPILKKYYLKWTKMEPVLDKTRARRDSGMQSNEFEAVFLGEAVEKVQEILKGCYI
jgi:hypothetical protein